VRVGARTIKDIERRPEHELVSEIQNRLKNYRPKKVRRKLMRKRYWQMRPLWHPCILDRIIQQCFKRVLEPIAEAHRSKISDYDLADSANVA
jgi:RNA-directed DNA polymerase